MGLTSQGLADFFWGRAGVQYYYNTKEILYNDFYHYFYWYRFTTIFATTANFTTIFTITVLLLFLLLLFFGIPNFGNP